MYLKLEMALSLEKEGKWLQQALIDVSFLEDGTQGHAIVSARKMQSYLKMLTSDPNNEKTKEAYMNLKQWLVTTLRGIQGRRLDKLTTDYAQFGTDILR